MKLCIFSNNFKIISGFNFDFDRLFLSKAVILTGSLSVGFKTSSVKTSQVFLDEDIYAV